MVVWVFRALFVLASAGTAYSIGLDMGRPFVWIVAGILTSVAVILAEWFISRGPIALISSVVFGVLLGMLFATFMVSIVGLVLDKETMDLVRDDLTGAFIVVFSYLGIAFIYQSRERFNLIVPYVEFRREEKGLRPIVIDTSAIIDGRITDILKSGVFDGPLLVPQVVLRELHQLADSEDRLKRDRGRLGLKVLNELRDDLNVDIEIHETTSDQSRPVDEELVRVAKMVNGKLLTNDYNLNRRASVEGVAVVNLNKLANALKPVALPDELMRVRLVKPGEQPGQAVGYLADGTMVVVEGGEPLVGLEVEVIVTNTITRETGRMIFARTLDAGQSEPPGRVSRRHR